MKFHLNRLLWILGGATLIFSSACTELHFEEPVHADAPEIQTSPSFLKGQYEVISASMEGDLEEPFTLSVRFEQEGKTRLMASLETVIPAEKLKLLEGRFIQLQSEGKINSFYVSPDLVYYIMPGESESDEEDSVKQRGRIIRLEKEGKFFRSDEWATLTFVFDFENGQALDFEEGEWFDIPDPLTFENTGTASSKKMVAKANPKEAWISMEESEGHWSLFYLKKHSGRELLLKYTDEFNKSYFNEHRRRLEALLPWQKDGDTDDLLINPTAVQLKQLLAEPGLFGEMRLRKIK